MTDRRLEVGGERIAGEEQRHVTDLEQEGDARPVRHAAVLPELARAAGQRIVQPVEQILGGVVDHPQRVRPFGEQLLEPLARRRQQRAAGTTWEVEVHRSCHWDVDRLHTDHSGTTGTTTTGGGPARKRRAAWSPEEPWSRSSRRATSLMSMGHLVVVVGVTDMDGQDSRRWQHAGNRCVDNRVERGLKSD